jgi:hypothetical protein
MSEESDIISGLFPDSRAAVFGLPPKFTVLEELEHADSIRLATAFGHMSGWEKLEPAINKCKGTIRLITGLDFFQTEPALLRTWNRASVNPRFRPRVMTSESGVFHPKVLIVSSPSKSFALVGSGNLSEGGLRTNIECSVYTRDEVHVRHLAKWFDGLFRRGQGFGEGDIREYEAKYKNVHRAVAKIYRQQRALETTLKNRHAAFLANRQKAANKAKRYWVIADGDDGDQWDDFYREGVVRITGRKELGDLRQYGSPRDVVLALKKTRPREFQSKNPASKARLCFNFAHEVGVGHRIFLRHGLKTIFGFGVVEPLTEAASAKASPYFFDRGHQFPHTLKVHWEKTGDFPLPKGFLLARNFIAPIDGVRLDTLKAAVGLGGGI